MLHALQSPRFGRIAFLTFFFTAIVYSFLNLRTVYEFAVEPVTLSSATLIEYSPENAAKIPVTSKVTELVMVVGEDGAEIPVNSSIAKTAAVEENSHLEDAASDVAGTAVTEEDERFREVDSMIPGPTVVVIPIPTSTPSPTLPVDYYLADAMVDHCEAVYGLSYLEDLASSKTLYSEGSIPNSSPSLECFRTNITEPRTDSFCVAHGALFNSTSHQFDVDCKLRDWNGAEAKQLQGIPQLHQFPHYMYKTGPAYTIPEHLNIARTHQTPGEEQNCYEANGNMAVLVKREGIRNPWHCLNEIFSFYMSMDVLWMSSRNAAALPLDYSKAQVVITDHEDEGPFWDLWGLFSGKLPIRLENFHSSSQASCPQDVLLPLPGGSNPLWHDDWLPQTCTDSQLLNAFTYRLRSFYNVTLPTNTSRPIVMTIIDRKETRRIANFDYYVQLVREGYPHVDVRVIDFAAYSFAEQVRLASETDILLGAHGAGLVHAMFMPKNGAVVEILPKGVNYRVYRNLAKLRGHRYFGTHATGDKIEGDWHGQDLEINDEEWLDLIEAAVKSMGNRGTLNMDIT